jgi:hypothetical protein
MVDLRALTFKVFSVEGVGEALVVEIVSVGVGEILMVEMPPPEAPEVDMGVGVGVGDGKTGSVGCEKGTELEFVIMVIAVSCVKLLSAHNSTQHTSRKHKV